MALNRLLRWKTWVTSPIAKDEDAELTYTVADSFLQTLAEKNDWISYHEADFESEEGRSIPYVILSTPERHVAKCSPSDKLRVWVQGESTSKNRSDRSAHEP